MRNRLAKKWQQMLLILNTQERSRAIFHVISSIRIPSSFAHVVRPDHVNRARDQAARTLKGVYSTKLEVLNEKWSSILQFHWLLPLSFDPIPRRQKALQK